MRKTNYLFPLIVISAILLAGDYFGILSPVKPPIESVVIPIKQFVHTSSVNASNFGILLTQYSSLSNKLEELQKLKNLTSEQSIKLEELEQENKTLRVQLQSPLPPTYEFIPSHVLGISRFLELGSGSRDGVKEGMAVVDGVTYVGETKTVSGLRSNVMLPTDPQSAIPVKTSRGAKGMATGQFGTSIIMEKILQKDAVFLDDQVLTSGEGGFPPNLLIGKISHILADDTSVYKQAKISPPFDYKMEKILFIISSQ
jgi:rod shape-determining protein MreC